MCGVHVVDLIAPEKVIFCTLSYWYMKKVDVDKTKTKKKTELKIMFLWDMLLNHVKITSMSIPVSL